MDMIQSRYMNSMLYWWPRVETISEVPMPKTVFVYSDIRHWYDVMDGKGLPDGVSDALKAVAKQIGYPLFVRGDQTSAKHDWERSCYVEKEKDLMNHLFAIIEFVGCAFTLTNDAFFFREYIEMASKYKAFRGMPVSPERRYFCENGKVLCHHHYWIKEAIHMPSVENWEELSDKMNHEGGLEIELLTSYAKKISKRLPGIWSIDFCLARDGTWYFIDCALAQDSWHTEGCEHNYKQPEGL